MNGIISALAGAPSAASNTQGYYQNAMNNEINAYGSPAANIFGAEQTAAFQPAFQQQDRNLLAQLNSTGIANSGSAKASLSDLYGQQSATEAGAIAPLYSQALGAYSGINSAMPGAQTTSYQDAINNFYNELNQAGADYTGGAALPGGGTTSQAPGNFYGPGSGGAYQNWGTGGGATDPYAGSTPGYG